MKDSIGDEAKLHTRQQKERLMGIIFICEKEDKSKMKVRDNNLNHRETP